MHQRQCLSFISSAGLRTPLAALLITMSRWSNSFLIVANISSTLSGSATLPCTAIVRRPPAASSRHNASASSWLL